MFKLEEMAANAASTNAYLIGGHGDNGSKTFIVPVGCIVVVAVHAGELSLLPPQIKKKFLTLSSQIFANPLKYKGHLVKTFGSLAFYKPGDICPNFEYSLLGCHFDRGEFEFCDESFSGLMDLTKFNGSNGSKGENWGKTLGLGITEYPYETLDTILFSKVEDTIDFFANLFKFSVEPSESDVKAMIFKALGDGLRDKLERASSCLKQFKILAERFHFSLDQKTLCELHPGVHYNFLCRFTGTDSLYNYSNIPSIVKEENLLSINFRGRRTNAATAANTKIIRDQISEAEIQRKPAIRNAFKKGGRLTRKKRIR